LVKKQVAIARHVKETLGERQAPGISFTFRPCLVDKDRNAPIEPPRQLCVIRASKDRTRPGVWVEQFEVRWHKREASPVIVKLPHLRAKERELRSKCRTDS
jgi:hypothetical protein